MVATTLDGRATDGSASTQGTCSVVAPGTVTVMTPPYAQLHVELLLRTGMFPIITVGLPVTHGATVIGVHVPGVSTPRAAAVCAAVIGFDSERQTPNGAMFSIGVLSMIVAAGLFSIITRLVGSTLNVDGATPKEHINVAVAVTGMPMRRP